MSKRIKRTKLNIVKAEWSGGYPSLCCGSWKLIVNGKDVSKCIPRRSRNEPMYTYGKYQIWDFDDDYCEYFESYYNGLTENEWIKKNNYWLERITNDNDVKSKIYKAIQENDWRHGSCGGCI